MLKLPTHGRYDYSSIEKRRNFDWPGGKRLAFYVALNAEEFAFMAGRGNDPFLRGNGPQTQRNYAWRDYGLRVGIWRIFRMLDELKLPATILLNSLVSANFPDVVERIKQRGDDVCNHGRTNATTLGRSSRTWWSSSSMRWSNNAPNNRLSWRWRCIPLFAASPSGFVRCGRPCSTAWATNLATGCGGHALSTSPTTASLCRQA